VKTEGDAFMIVFTRPADAVYFGIDLQMDLLQ
jgi:class 3 adenylate cyclase